MDILKSINKDEVINIVCDLVKIPSINPPGAENDVGDYIMEYMRENGIETSRQEVLPGRSNIISRMKGRGSAPAIIFTGHMDVVPVSRSEEQLWNMEPFAANIIDGFIYGRGSTDMKGGLGAAMVAMATLQRNNFQPHGDIILLATVDEEDLMRGAKALLGTSYLDGATKAIVCEPTNMMLVTSCRGRSWADVIVKGRTAHASQEGAGVNAIDRARLLMNKIYTHTLTCTPHNVLGNSFWQVTLIKGGIEPAIVPDTCTLTVDSRLIPGQLSQDIWEEMNSLIHSLKEDIPDFSADIKIIEEREPWETPADDSIVRVLQDACNQVGRKVQIGGFLGTTDGTILKRDGIDVVIFGPGSLEFAHKENERVSIDELLEAAQIYLYTMLNWKG